MLDVFFGIALILLYFYYITQIGSVQNGINKFLVTITILTAFLLPGIIFDCQFISWILISVTMLLFDLFYDSEPFIFQWYKSIALGIIITFFLIINKSFDFFTHLVIYELCLLAASYILSSIRKCLNMSNKILIALVFTEVIAATIYADDKFIKLLMFILASSVFLILEFIFQSYRVNFEKSSEYFQQNVLHNQYEEIKNIYLNMRGWRHDYHSHLQTIKAHLALNQLDEVQKYLLELELDLSRVDSYVKSGNLMADAILNSKISIAENRGINVICKAEIPENLMISDIDMCVIFGNLLDNAIEACLKIDEDKRFIRIYTTIIKNQLYTSIQNSAKEELDFNERNYISTKLGEHGLGMKRVKILIDKYNGYLNLQNEPGIFASEITVPLDI